MAELGASLLTLTIVLAGLAIMTQAWRIGFVRRLLGAGVVLSLVLLVLPGFLAGITWPPLAWPALPAGGFGCAAPTASAPPGGGAALGWYALLLGGLTVTWLWARVREGSE